MAAGAGGARGRAAFRSFAGPRSRCSCAQLKAGELHASASVGVELIKTHQPLEAQVLGYTLLQHLVGGGCARGGARGRCQQCTAVAIPVRSLAHGAIVLAAADLALHPSLKRFRRALPGSCSSGVQMAGRVQAL